MEKSSTDSPSISSQKPEVEGQGPEQQARKPQGLFIPDLVDGVFGTDWRTVIHEVPDVVEMARGWNHDALLAPDSVTGIRKAFLHGGRIPHVCLTQALQAGKALQIHQALKDACFRRHHFAAYPLWVARRKEQDPTLLTAFMDWLESQEAARYHAWLTGWPYPLPETFSTQVQASLMGVGDHFPIHHDSDEEGIAAVYNFSMDWHDGFGGDLFFPDEKGERCELYIPSRFNTLFLFRPRGAAHGVSPVELASYGHFRFTITAFYIIDERS